MRPFLYSLLYTLYSMLAQLKITPMKSSVCKSVAVEYLHYNNFSVFLTLLTRHIFYIYYNKENYYHLHFESIIIVEIMKIIMGVAHLCAVKGPGSDYYFC